MIRVIFGNPVLQYEGGNTAMFPMYVVILSAGVRWGREITHVCNSYAFDPIGIKRMDYHNAETFIRNQCNMLVEKLLEYIRDKFQIGAGEIYELDCEPQKVVDKCAILVLEKFGLCNFKNYVNAAHTTHCESQRKQGFLDDLTKTTLKDLPKPPIEGTDYSLVTKLFGQQTKPEVKKISWLDKLKKIWYLISNKKEKRLKPIKKRLRRDSWNYQAAE